MGAENSVLEGCLWGEEVVAAGLDWDLQHAELKDSRPITVFQPRKNERKYNEMIQQLAKSLKMLRHPSILRYIGAGKSSEAYFLATEQATPLTVILDKLTPLELCSGLCDILDALTFLHEKAGVTHNNVSVSAIFVCKDGSWKLGELQHACPFTSATADFLDACRAFRNQDALAPEEKQNDMGTKSDQGHARDMYGMGVLCEQLTEQLSELGEFDKSFEQKIATCLSTDPAQRPRALELRNDCLFQNDFIQILSFVRNVALKTVEEKNEFFRCLLVRLVALPEELVARRLAIPLLSRFVLLDEAAVTHVVPHLLTPRTDSDVSSSAEGAVNALLGEELFRNYVIPELQRILLVHDAHIRLVLLQHFSAYAGLFDRETLHNEVFPQILLGLRDSSDSIVASSLRALADLVPLLGGDIIIGGQRKTFFFQGMPKFLPMREKENSPSSAGEVLWPDSKKLLSNGKPLLKDLIAGGVSTPSKEVDQERRRQERERRREEARRKKEERQRKFRLLQAELEMEQQQKRAADTDKGSTDDSTDTVTGSSSTHRAEMDAEKEDIHHRHKPGDSFSDTDEESAHDSSRERTDTNVRIEEEKFASEEEEEWEDWEDKESNSGQKSQDDDISDEIEAELSQMSGNRPSKGGGQKVPTSPDPYTPSSPVEVDWSDSQFDPVLSSPKWGKGEKTPQGIAKTNSPGLISEKPSDSKQASGKGLKLVGKNKIAPAAKATQAKKTPVASDDLGLGYDIKSIELSVAREEEDFFADMTPDIKPSVGRGVMDAGVKVEARAVWDQSPHGPGSSLFAVADTGAEESAGWEEEGDWGGDF